MKRIDEWCVNDSKDLVFLLSYIANLSRHNHSAIHLINRLASNNLPSGVNAKCYAIPCLEQPYFIVGKFTWSYSNMISRVHILDESCLYNMKVIAI